MIERFSRLPNSLVRASRREMLPGLAGGERVPALIAHPDPEWARPVPLVLWMHGRTVSKETDPGRYLRWLRAGIGACAVDLPGHGERFVEGAQGPDNTLNVLEQALAEVDPVLDGLAERYPDAFDHTRVAIGGMSAGGMVTLRRLCDPHRFTCAAVESTAGSFDLMPQYDARHPREQIERLDPMRHLDEWRAIPLLALHSEADEWVPLQAISAFLDGVRTKTGQRTDEVRLVTWPTTGAPAEHAGFGRHASEAKTIQTDFLSAHLL